MFKAALTLAEAGMGQFDECVDALKKCNGDENAALQLLVENKKKNEWESKRLQSSWLNLICEFSSKLGRKEL